MQDVDRGKSGLQNSKQDKPQGNSRAQRADRTVHSRSGPENTESGFQKETEREKSA